MDACCCEGGGDEQRLICIRSLMKFKDRAGVGWWGRAGVGFYELINKVKVRDSRSEEPQQHKRTPLTLGYKS